MDEAPDQPSQSTDEQMITTTSEELKVAVGEAMQVATAELSEKVQTAVDEIAVVVQQVEEVKAQLTEAAQIVEADIVAKAAEEAQSPATPIQPAPTENGKAETAAVKHIIASRKFDRFFELFLIICVVAFAGLFMVERSILEQQTISHAKIIKELATDLINSQLIKNENIETAIETKLDLLKKDLPISKAVPMAYIDGEVVKEVINDLPLSVKSLPDTEQLVLNELKKISAYAERELNKK